MPDDTAPEQVSGGTDQVSDPTGQVPQDADEGFRLQGEFDAQRAQSLVKKLRADLSALREEKRVRDEADLSEKEKMAKRADSLERDLRKAQKQHQDRELDWALERAAAKQGCADPEAARLLLRQSDLLEVDDEGKPRNVDQALKHLLKERPWLAATQSGPPPSVGNPATRASGPGQRIYTRADLQNHQTYLQNRDDIIAAYREGRLTD